VSALPPDATCDAALRFAARDSATIDVRQSDLRDYLARWERVVRAEPQLRNRVPQTYRTVKWIQLTIFTSNPLVIDAWSAGVLETGDEEVDDAVRALREPRLHGATGGDEMVRYFVLNVGGIYNEEALQAQLMRGGTWLDTAIKRSGDDGVWSWNGEGADRVATIDFTFGWGDCFVECQGYRTIRGVVSAEKEPEMYDLGGDPLPPGVELAPGTQPVR
jgi:hypothetical protein